MSVYGRRCLKPGCRGAVAAEVSVVYLVNEPPNLYLDEVYRQTNL